MKCITYDGGYKYQLKETYTEAVEIRPAAPIKSEYVALDPDGNLTIHGGYAWDSPSGPTIDSLNSMRGSLVHDALYQLMRDEKARLMEKQKALPRPAATHAALIPIRKSDTWWALPQDERRKIFGEQSDHIQIGMKYLPAIARRLHHSAATSRPPNRSIL